jgi:DNA integrity scanning protein DisA with diadenylate cyclase activity
MEAGKVKKAERVQCLLSLGGRKLIDTLRIARVEEHYGPIPPGDVKRIGRQVPIDLLFLMVNLAVEIGQEGREGAPVGTIFVIGDTEKVLELSKSMIFNPFRGYSEEERNIFDTKVQESIKELTLIDGAFVIREDGVVISAGRFLHAGAGKTSLIKGLGARHAAAAAITHHTRAVAITVSQSTGTIRIFSGGKTVRSIRTYRPPLGIIKR